MKSNFPIVTLGSHVRQVSQRNKAEAGIEVYSVTNSEGFTRSTDYFSKEVFSKDVSNYKIVRRGQFAYNPSRINVGSIDYLKQAEQALVSPLYIVFEADELLYPEYLFRYLKSDWGNSQIRANTEGAVRDSLKFKGLESIKIPFPQLDDQIRIAYLLSKVEGLIAQRKQHLQQLDDLLKNIFLEMFGDPVRNERGWDTLSFSKVGKFKSGGTPSKSREDFWKGGYPWVSPKDMKASKIEGSEDHISESVFEETTLKRIAPRHLLIVVRGMILAHSFPVAINTIEVAINQDMKAIKPVKGVNVVYLQHCLNSLKRQVLKLISTAGHGTRKFDSVAMQKLFIPVPLPKLQNQFATIVEKVESIKSRYQQSLTELENLYGALSQKAFKGELDLSRVPLLVKLDVADSLVMQLEEKVNGGHVTTSIDVVDEYPMANPAARERLLRRLFDEFLHDIKKGATLSLDYFWQSVHWKAIDFTHEGEQPFGAAEYELIKHWLFEAIKSGLLEQGFDDDNNQISLKLAG